MARRLNMRALIAPASEVDFTGVEEIPAEWRKPLPVRSALSVPEIGLMFELETAIQNPDLSDSASVREPVDQAYRLVMNLLREQTPELPDLPLSIDTTLRLMAWLAGADSVAEAVQDTIRGRDEDEVDADAAFDGGEGDGEHGELAAVADEAPLRSAKPSRRPSSPSGKGSRGGRSGGATVPGEPSVVTAPTSKVA
jgi:hypothetical protein